jgi:hypothetical protein
LNSCSFSVSLSLPIIISQYLWLTSFISRLLRRFKLLAVVFVTRPVGNEDAQTQRAAAGWQGVTERMGGLPTKRGWIQSHIHTTCFLYVFRYLSFLAFAVLIPRMCT